METKTFAGGGWSLIDSTEKVYELQLCSYVFVFTLGNSLIMMEQYVQIEFSNFS